MTADLEQWRANGGIHPVDRARDQLTRQFTCPACGAAPRLNVGAPPRLPAGMGGDKPASMLTRAVADGDF
jgi:hypothetical protein